MDTAHVFVSCSLRYRNEAEVGEASVKHDFRDINSSKNIEGKWVSVATFQEDYELIDNAPSELKHRNVFWENLAAYIV